MLYLCIMIVSERMLKWAMRAYPPLLFQRIWVKQVHRGFMGVTVTVNKSLFNKNYNASVFGGSLFSSADPFYPVLFHQIFLRKGYKVVVWLKSATIQYVKPVRESISFNILLNDVQIDKAEADLTMLGKHVQFYPIEMFNPDGELAVAMTAEIYIRDLNFKTI